MAAAAPLPVQSRYDQADVVATIKQTVAKGATDAQLRMFLEVCRSTGLDPFLKEIWYVAEKGIIMAARDGYLRVANESPNFDGMETHVERDDRNVPIKATCTVWRKDRTHPIVCEAWFSEYVKTSTVWKQYPSAMISKVAEVLALKRSFAINGVVTEEEIGFDGSGSQAAADAVAQTKIGELRAAAMSRTAQPAVEVMERILEPEDEGRYAATYSYDEPESDQLAQELHESILLVESLKPKNRKNPDRFAMLREFAALKGRYKAIGFEKTYYAYLGQYGVSHSNQFTDDDEGLSMARRCYKEMSIDLANREVRGR